MAPRPAAWKIVTAFALVYVVWGSTYLAIKWAVEGLPPLLMAGTRFLLAGLLLYAWTRMRGAARPQPRHWAAAALVGLLLPLGGNGLLSWAEQTVPSGVASLVIATIPLWTTLLAQGMRFEGHAGFAAWAGLLLGFAGVALLLVPGADGSAAPLLGAVVLLVASLSWSLGSVLQPRLPRPGDLLQTIAMQMICGGAFLYAAGGLAGEWGRLDVEGAGPRSLASLAYLTVLGTLVTYTAFTWLLHHVPPSRVATYAYVNPLVAVVLGAALGGEDLTLRIAVATVVIVSGVALTLAGRATRPAVRLPPNAAGAPGRP